MVFLAVSLWQKLYSQHMSLYQELKRRNVLRVAAAYTIAAWLLVQVAETIFPLFGYGDAPARIVVVVLAIGFVPAIIISWAFEITPEGLKRDADVDRDNSITPHSTKKLDRIIIAALVVALAYFAFDKFVLDPQRDLEITASAVRTGAEQAREEARLDIFSDKSIAANKAAKTAKAKAKKASDPTVGEKRTGGGTIIGGSNDVKQRVAAGLNPVAGLDVSAEEALEMASTSGVTATVSALSDLIEFGVSNSQAWEVGIACGGKIEVYVEPITS